MEKFWEWVYDEDKLVAAPALLLGMAGIAGFIVAADNLVKDLITTGEAASRSVFTFRNVVGGILDLQKASFTQSQKEPIGNYHRAYYGEQQRQDKTENRFHEVVDTTR